MICQLVTNAWSHQLTNPKKSHSFSCVLRNISQELPPPPGAWSAPKASQLLCGGKINKSTKAEGMKACKGATRLNKISESRIP